MERHDSLVHGMRFGSEEEAISEESVTRFLGRLRELFVPDQSGSTEEARRNKHRRASMPGRVGAQQQQGSMRAAASAVSGAGAAVAGTGAGAGAGAGTGAAAGSTPPSYRRASTGVATEPLPYYAQEQAIEQPKVSRMQMRAVQQEDQRYCGPNMR